ncbi:MAG: YedE family putative selenium transporter [Anaerolineae bacterium]|jgi:YedE family putative selenium metabolism protein|nr:YedE-related selenium metabolism membrane protein [Chloroflexota bacterium]
MTRLRNLLISRWGPVITGAIIGILAPILVYYGNPGNMGICVACFTRDIAGALGLHRAAPVQYIRPEIIGLLLGALFAALAAREFRPRGGSSPLIRFFLGLFAMIGALVFLGCPWRAYLRLAGGDVNAIPGIVGLVIGIVIGVQFLARGFSLGRSRPAPAAAGWIMPALAVVLLVLLLTAPLFGRDADGVPTGPIYFSSTGPGSMAAPVALSLVVGLVIGALAQRSRFCTVGAFRDVILLRDAHLLRGIIALVLAAFVTNLVLGQFHLGLADQPVSHTNALWNAGGMVLAGLAFTLAGGCPGRQLFMSGEGDADAGVFVLGMAAGAAVSHIYSLASAPAGPAPYGPAAVVLGLIFCVVIGFTARDHQSA